MSEFWTYGFFGFLALCVVIEQVFRHRRRKRLRQGLEEEKPERPWNGDEVEGFTVRAWMERRRKGHRISGETKYTIHYTGTRLPELPRDFTVRLASSREKRAQIKAQEAAGVEVPVPDPLRFETLDTALTERILARPGMESAIVEFIARVDDDWGEIEQGVVRLVSPRATHDPLVKEARMETVLDLAKLIRAACAGEEGH